MFFVPKKWTWGRSENLQSVLHMYQPNQLRWTVLRKGKQWMMCLGMNADDKDNRQMLNVYYLLGTVHSTLETQFMLIFNASLKDYYIVKLGGCPKTT